MRSEDAFLDAVVDAFTAAPTAALPAVLAAVSRAEAAHTTGARAEQRRATQQRAGAAQLRGEWAAAVAAAASHTASPTPVPPLDALISKSAVYLETLTAGAADRGDAPHASPPLQTVPTPPQLAAEALAPLTAALTHPHSARDGAVRTLLQHAYVHLLPSLLHTAAAASPLQLYALLRHPSGAAAAAPAVAAVPSLLAPYRAATSAPLERELRFHFAAGRATAAVHEPQHFFAFLQTCLEGRLRTAASEWAAAAAPSSPAEASLRLLRSVSEIEVCATAAAVFVECYGWRPGSPLLRLREYVLVTVNAVLDFVVAVEGRVHHEAVQLLCDHLLPESVLEAFAESGAAVAAAALHDGATRLWRRAFLVEGTGRAAFPLYACSLHVVRALEAFTRRLLPSLLPVRATAGALVWSRTVKPSLSAFLSAAEAAVPPSTGDDAAAASWHDVLTLQWCVACAQVVAAAAEDWLGTLREGAAPAPASPAAGSDALDGLVLFRDALVRRAADQAKRLTRRLCTRRAGHGAQAALLLREAEDAFGGMEALPEGTPTLYVVPDVVRGVLGSDLTAEQRAEMLSYARRAGLPRVAALLAA